MKGPKDRKKKTHDQKQRQERLRREKKDRLESVLSALGLLKGFQELPGSVRQRAILSVPDRPKVVISPTAQCSPTMKELKADIEYHLDRATIVTDDGNSFPASELLSVCWALPAGFSSLISAPLSQKCKAFVIHARRISLDFLKKWLNDAMKSLSIEAMIDLAAYSRSDSKIFGCFLEDNVLGQGKLRFQITLQSSEPRQIRVEIDGHVRPAFQCALPWNLEGIRWMECDGAAFGLDKDKRYPIFLQSHAIQRLQERLSGSLLPEVTIHFGLMCSLAEPTVVERQGDKFLIEFHHGGIRMGYLVARVIENKIVITTFLLLTMQGTPESRLLWQKLHLTRPDVEYARLDRLETFLTPDFFADKQLVDLFEECGCGPLLALGRKGFPHKEVEGRAEELKRFLRITDSSNQELFKKFSSPQSWSA